MYPIFSEIWFWVLVLGLGVTATGWALYESTPLKKLLPITKGMLALIGVGGLLLMTSVGGMVGLKDAGTGSMADGSFQITNLQVTTAFTSDVADATSNVTESSVMDDLIDLRLTDAQVVETAASEELYTGIITVTRSGSTDPASCPVTLNMPADYPLDAGDDGTRYNIIEKTSTGDYEVYLQSGAAATITSPKGETQLAFTDGAATSTLGIVFEVDEEGHDAMSKYGYREVGVNICGKVMTFRIHRMD